jgi:cytochrome c oxidase subunit II
MNSWIPFFPDQASSFAWQVDALYFYLVAITVFFTVAIVGVIAVFFVKYREREKYAHPSEIEGSTALEVTWSIIPFVIAMTIFVGGAVVYYNLYRIPTEAMEVYVVGKQWMWKFQHATGQREINELHIPVGRKVKLTMTTEDVLHDLYFPTFRTKADVVPGRFTTLWFEATKPGKYRIYCAEYCGLNHSGMGGYVYVMEQRDFDNWLAGNTSNQTPAEAGKELFEAKLGCASCHAADGSGGRGPALVGLYGKPVRLANGQTVQADEGYIRESILNPQAQIVEGYQPIMPTFKGQVSEEQLVSLVAYIKSIGGSGGAAPSGISPSQPVPQPNASRNFDTDGQLIPPGGAGSGTTTTGGSGGANSSGTTTGGGANRQGGNR